MPVSAPKARKLFHVTLKSQLPSILESGLDPTFSKSSLPAVFLADCMDGAMSYACSTEEPCALLEVTVKPDLLDLGPDNYELRDMLLMLTPEELAAHGLSEDARWADCTWQQSLAVCGQVACYSIIPASQIRIISTQL